MLFIKAHRNSPLERGARNAQVLKPGQQKVVEHLVCPGNRLYELRMRPDVLDKRGSVLAGAEKVAFLLHKLGLPSAIRAAAVYKLAVQPEGFARRAVMARVAGLVYIALVVELFKYPLHALCVIAVGGAHKPVVGYVKAFPQVLKRGHYGVDVRLGRYPLFSGFLLYLLPVLVGSGQEINVQPHLPLVARYSVGRHGGIRMADVQPVAWIVDGRGDVISVFTHNFKSPFV